MTVLVEEKEKMLLEALLKKVNAKGELKEALENAFEAVHLAGESLDAFAEIFEEMFEGGSPAGGWVGVVNGLLLGVGIAIQMSKSVTGKLRMYEMRAISYTITVGNLCIEKMDAADGILLGSASGSGSASVSR